MGFSSLGLFGAGFGWLIQGSISGGGVSTTGVPIGLLLALTKAS